MAAFYSVMSGKADYRPAPGYEHKLHMIGPRLAPIWVGEACEVASLFDDLFWTVYQEWQRFHLGLSVPDGGSWIADAVLALEGQYRAHFSAERQIIARLDALIDIYRPKRVR
jgi:hypothetical protein